MAAEPALMPALAGPKQRAAPGRGRALPHGAGVGAGAAGLACSCRFGRPSRRLKVAERLGNTEMGRGGGGYGAVRPLSCIYDIARVSRFVLLPPPFGPSVEAIRWEG